MGVQTRTERDRVARNIEESHKNKLAELDKLQKRIDEETQIFMQLDVKKKHLESCIDAYRTQLSMLESEVDNFDKRHKDKLNSIELQKDTLKNEIEKTRQLNAELSERIVTENVGYWCEIVNKD